MTAPHPSPKDSPSPKNNISRIVWALMFALALWALYLALGALLYRPENADHLAWRRGIYRSLLVLGCFTGFLTFWIALLKLRARRQ